MNTNPTHETATESPVRRIPLRIFGVGSAGMTVLEQIADASLCVAVSTGPEAAQSSPAAERLLLEPRPSRGPVPGGDAARARAAAEEHVSRLKAACEGADMVFVVAGLGGGGGTGIAPVLARAAKETGALVLAFVTLPFDCEGNRRQRQALQALHRLKAVADGVICLPNQKIFKLIDEKTSVTDTFKLSSSLLAEGVNGIHCLLAHKGLIEIHPDDVCALLRERSGECALATAEATGPERSREVVDKLLAHPLLDGGKFLAECDAVLVSVTGGSDLTMAEINRVMQLIDGKCGPAQVIMGAAVDESFRERLAVSMIAARRGDSADAGAGLDEADADAEPPFEQFDEHLLNREPAVRPHSRFVPPPPALGPDKMEQLLSRRARAGSRSRKNSSRMHQTQLPLEIVSKGRFDKSEPTIHKGADLDVPTYIRRGVQLN